MTRPAETLTIRDEDGVRVWAPRKRALPISPRETRIVDVQAARAWLDEERARARVASGLGFWARRREWFAQPIVHVSTAMRVGTFRMRMDGGLLYRESVTLAVPESTPPSLVPPGAWPDFEVVGMARTFFFPDDEPALPLAAEVTLVPCQGADVHWRRDLTSNEWRVLSPA